MLSRIISALIDKFIIDQSAIDQAIEIGTATWSDD